MFTIKITDITDSILAMASLRGDITGRGDVLVDNDCYALRHLALTLVPTLLTRNGIDFAKKGDAWRIGPTHLFKAELVLYLSRHVLADITGNPGLVQGLHLRSDYVCHGLTVTPYDL